MQGNYARRAPSGQLHMRADPDARTHMVADE